MSVDRPAWEFEATGTRWHVYHSGQLGAEVAEAVLRLVARDERRWSRFAPDSELSQLNAHAGRWRPVSTEKFALLESCALWTERTGGVFQPLDSTDLVRIGYGESFALGAVQVAVTPSPRPVEGRIELDRRSQAVRIPARTTLDLGGIGKGWIAARAGRLAARLSDDPELLIDAGGDLYAVTGRHLVAIEDSTCDDGSTNTWVRLQPRQAIATSGYERRRWRNGDGVRVQHLIDPYTGAPGPLVHGTGWRATR